jgi:hypothetical protein
MSLSNLNESIGKHAPIIHTAIVTVLHPLIIEGLGNW